MLFSQHTNKQILRIFIPRESHRMNRLRHMIFNRPAHLVGVTHFCVAEMNAGAAELLHNQHTEPECTQLCSTIRTECYDGVRIVVANIKNTVHTHKSANRTHTQKCNRVEQKVSLRLFTTSAAFRRCRRCRRRMCEC